MSDEALRDNLTISEAQARRNPYVAALADEIDVGRQASLADLRAGRIEHPKIVRYKARRIGGSGRCGNHEEWLDPLVTRFGPRRSGLSLGAGLGRVERHLVERGLCQHFESLDVCIGKTRNDEADLLGASERFMDLNFASLQPEKYDFILCHGVLHHLINLEFVLDQINTALTPDGIVLIYEYIGECHWQFSASRFKALRRRFPAAPIKPVARWSIPGFESIRSDELQHLIQSVFGTSVLHSSFFGGIYFPFLTCTTAAQDHLLDEVVKYDELASDSGELPPCYHVGVYGKSSNRAPRAVPWSDELLSQRLRRVVPPAQRLVAALRRSPLGPALRKLKRSLVDA